MERKLQIILSLKNLKQKLSEAIKAAEADSETLIDANISQAIDQCGSLLESICQRLSGSDEVYHYADHVQKCEHTESSVYEFCQLHPSTSYSKDVMKSRVDISSESASQSVVKTGDEDFDDFAFDGTFATASESAPLFLKDKVEEKHDETLPLEADFDDEDDDDLLLSTSMDDVNADVITIPDELEDGESSKFEEHKLEIDTDENDAFDQPDKAYLEVLKRNFGHSEFRHHQWEIIDAVLNQKRDSCVIMSTGYGKSLTFQFPSVFTGHASIVVSPLISLMEDQVRALQASGIKACFLGSAQKNSGEVKDEMLRGKYRLIYVTPEYLSGDGALTLLRRLDAAVGIDLFAVDESHCVSQWGVDFRASYRRLGCIKENFPSVPVLAVTATATARVQKDICSILKLRNPKLVCTSFDRPNLFLSVIKKQVDLVSDLKSLMQKDGKKFSFDGPTIIYCPTRTETTAVANAISSLKVSCMAYHAGLTPNARQEAHHKFLNDEIQVIVATVAFGMGIDKPDVRRVIHYGAPKDIESYYQEIGRAGRDGMRSYCKVMYAESDFRVNMFMLNKMENENYKKHKFEMFQKMKQYLSAQKCRRRLLLSYFERGSVEDIGGTVNCCDHCRSRILSERNGNKVQSSDQDSTTMVDYGRETGDLLSAVQCTGGYYGLEVPALVLTGSTSSRVTRFTNTIVFGSGKYRSKKFWTVFGKCLIEEGYLCEQMIQGGFGCSVNVTPKAKAWELKEKRISDPPKLLLEPSSELKMEDRSIPKSNVSVSFKPKVVPALSVPPSFLAPSVEEVPATAMLPPVDKVDPKTQALQAELYASLLKVRRTVAEETGYTPHSIASNKILLDMAKYRPSTMEQLVHLEDFSALKAEKFGHNFLLCMVKFCKEKDLAMDEFPKGSNALTDDACESQALKEALMRISSSQRQSYIFFILKKLSLEETAIQVGLKTSTIVTHMCEAIKAGLEVDLERLGVATASQQLIRKTILAPPVNGVISSLTRIKDCLPASIEYNHIKLVIAKMVCQFGQKMNDSGDLVVNTNAVVTPVIMSDVECSQEESLQEPSSSWMSTKKRQSSSPTPSSTSTTSPDDSLGCTAPPTKLRKASTTLGSGAVESTQKTSPMTQPSPAASGTARDRRAVNGQPNGPTPPPALKKSSSQEGSRALPPWMQASQNKSVFKKKLKSNSLFK